jgi:hypothetical protein
MSSMAVVTSSAVSTTSSAAGITCLSHLEWTLGFSFPGTSLDPLFCLSCWTNSRTTDSYVNVLEECNPVVLVLILTLVSVGRPSTGAHGSKESVLLAFLFPIRHSQNYEENHGEMMMQRDLSTSTVVREYVRTKKHQETEIRFHSKQDFVSTPLETKFCFHST